MASKSEITHNKDIYNEKTVDIIQQEPNEKAGLHIDDEAGKLVGLALASGPAEAEISKRVLRKIDFYILPFLCVTYGMLACFEPLARKCGSWRCLPTGLQFMDKTSLGYSSVFGIIEDTHLIGQDYSWAS